MKFFCIRCQCSDDRTIQYFGLCAQNVHPFHQCGKFPAILQNMRRSSSRVGKDSKQLTKTCLVYNFSKLGLLRKFKSSYNQLHMASCYLFCLRKMMAFIAFHWRYCFQAAFVLHFFSFSAVLYAPSGSAVENFSPAGSSEKCSLKYIFILPYPC